MNVVTPNDTANSYLWHKINGTHGKVGGKGGEMPKDGNPDFGTVERDMIETWILEGAPE